MVSHNERGDNKTTRWFSIKPAFDQTKDFYKITFSSNLFHLTDRNLPSITRNAHSHRVKDISQHQATNCASASGRFSIRPNEIVHWSTSCCPEPASARADICPGDPGATDTLNVVPKVKQHLEEGKLLRCPDVHQRAVSFRHFHLAVLVSVNPTEGMGDVEKETAHVHKGGIRPLLWTRSALRRSDCREGQESGCDQEQHRPNCPANPKNMQADKSQEFKITLQLCQGGRCWQAFIKCKKIPSIRSLGTWFLIHQNNVVFAHNTKNSNKTVSNKHILLKAL